MELLSDEVTTSSTNEHDSETEHDPVGLLGMEAFARFLFVSFLKGIDSNLHDLPWVPKGRFKQLLIRKGRVCRDKGGAIKKQ